MKIEAFIIGWNREDTIALTIQYYQRFCNKITLFDNHSTDSTREIASSLGATVLRFGTPGVLNDQDYLNIKNQAWKDSDADWVIVVDDDEILWGFNLEEELQFAKDSGATIIKPKGFGIFSNEMPELDWTELMSGVPDENYSKLCVFNPKAIQEIGYIFGCHQAKPVGRIRLVEKLYLLHYRAGGGADRLIERHKLYEPRRQKSAINLRWDLGGHYRKTVENPEETRLWFEENLGQSKPLVVDGGR